MMRIGWLGVGIFALVVAAAPGAAAAEAPQLDIYNWSDYIAPDTIADFREGDRDQGHL